LIVIPPLPAQAGKARNLLFPSPEIRKRCHFPLNWRCLHERPAAHSLDPALVCAVVEQESAWNPWAIRYEPLFFAKYVASLYTNNKVSASEAYARGFSWD